MKITSHIKEDTSP